jgi:hypothetical protein
MKVTLMLNQNDIPSLTSFDGNIDADKLKPYIYLAQKNDVKKALGAALYKKIYDDYVAGNLAGIYETIYNDYVVEMLVYFSCSKYMAFGGYKTNNNGIHKVAFGGAQVVDYKEVAILISRYDQLATNAENSFYEYMSAADILAQVPEFKTDTNDTDEQKIIPWY